MADIWHRLEMLVFVAVIFPISAIIVLAYPQKAAHLVSWYTCLTMGHEWADRKRYGVRPICLRCEKTRVLKYD